MLRKISGAIGQTISRPKEKPLMFVHQGLELEPGSDLLLHGESPTLSSALSGFTSEFEMVSGGSHLLWPPGKLLPPKAAVKSYK